jgi:hypothetical protein
MRQIKPSQMKDSINVAFASTPFEAMRIIQLLYLVGKLRREFYY